MRGVRAPLVAAAIAAGASAVLTSRRQFIAKLDALDRQLAEGQNSAEPRTDLPKHVAALATRLGATGKSPALFVDLLQIGTMWFKPGGSPQRFTARQRIGTTSAGFVWRAKIGPLGAMWVVDALVAGSGFLEARVLGILRVARIEGTVAATQGEALRYLAELPFNPDAILFDRSLEWSSDNARTVCVATGTGDARAQISFELDQDGLIRTASAASRAYGQTGQRYPWHGRFWDYQPMSGRSIPTQAEVAWVIDGKDFIYWRGKLESWQAVSTDAGAR